METLQLAKVLRIKSCHLKEIDKVFDLQDALNLLNQKAFVMIEQSSDGFFVTFENPQYNNGDKNTLVFFNTKGYFVDANYN